MLEAIYGPGSPNPASALSQLRNIKDHAENGRFSNAQTSANQLLQQIDQHKASLTGYSAESFAEFTNALFCYVRLAELVGEVDPDDGIYIFEADNNPETEFVGVHPNGLGGIQLFGDGFTGIIVVILKHDEFPWPPGKGPLKTDLDQYGEYFSVETTWSGDFLREFIIGICSIDESLLPPGFGTYGRVGHRGVNDEGDFEITARKARPDWLTCQPEQSATSRGVRSERGKGTSIIAMNEFFTRSGFGGSAINNSDFGLVDSRSGFGGSAINNSPTDGVVMFSHGEPVFSCGTPAPGTRADCDPAVQVATPLFFDHTSESDGHAFKDVEVTFTATVGGVAGGLLQEKLANGDCSLTNTGQSVIVKTDEEGKAAVCWQVGGPGENKVVATPSYTGELSGFQGDDPNAANYVAFLPPSTGEWIVNVVSGSMAFDGFYRPVRNPTELNKVKAGSSVPVKFSLGGDFGLGVIASGFPAVSTLSCSLGTVSAEVLDVEIRTVNAGLTFDPVTFQYTYVWKTEKNWAGKCYALRFKFTNNQEAVAYFSFFK